MSVELFIALIFCASVAAGLLGSLVGLGGGILIFPLLTIGFGLDICFAIGASIVSAITPSSDAGSALVSDGFTNIRIATFHQIATAFGAVAGTLLAPSLTGRLLHLLFGILLLVAVLPMLRRINPVAASCTWAQGLGLVGSYGDAACGQVPCGVVRVPLAW